MSEGRFAELKGSVRPKGAKRRAARLGAPAQIEFAFLRELFLFDTGVVALILFCWVFL